MKEIDLIEVLADIRARVLALGEAAWPELSYLIERSLPNPLPPMSLLPIVASEAIGIRTDKVIEVAAHIVLLDIALRTVDDCADEDNPNALYKFIGIGRAMNLAMALQTIVSNGLGCLNSISSEYYMSLLQVCRGQELDMKHAATTMEEYVNIVKLKTVAAYRFSVLAGGLAGTEDKKLLAQCALCGEHLGWMAQILDDIESLWFPAVKNRQMEELFTFPVFYGLEKTHPAAAELKVYMDNAHMDRSEICALLDDMNIRQELMTLALDHRDMAYQVLGKPFCQEGVVTLKILLDWLLRDGARLLEQN
ncbi:MAG: polyprenyl synthetase family protein [Betaproteobacteria bacterium]|nr:polyprenyl synthetase family protein [Betaproteobacteria bacterium]